MTPGQRAEAAPFRMFLTEVSRTLALSPTFVRLTLTASDLDRFADNGFDQRIKLLLPLPDRGLEHVPVGPDWYTDWRNLPEHRRNPIRTYTVRAVRPARREIDVDVALHGDSGPASRWARAARPGDAVAVLGPNADYDGVHGGIDFHPPPDAQHVLLAGDETALPAIMSILERLPRDARGEALLEVPERGDRSIDVDAPEGFRVGWLPREGALHGQLLVPAVEAAVDRLLADRTLVAAGEVALEDVDVDAGLLWEVPGADGSRPSAATAGVYAWLAGEAGVVKTLRRLLVRDLGVDRRSVAFMGYWRLGRAEANG
jgi:NADPH-dependent ferric siderophore reductase